MESGFQILRKNSFQPRILNLLKLSSRRIAFSDVLHLKKGDTVIKPGQIGAGQRLLEDTLPRRGT